MRRIDASCLWKETGDEPMSTALSHFQGNSVRIVYPQQRPFEEQLQLFKEHTTIMGIIGRAMPSALIHIHQLVYKRVINWIEKSRLLS